MSYLREYAIAAYIRIFLPHISRLHGPHMLKKNFRVFLTCLTLHVNVTPMAVEDRLLITSQTEKVGLLKEMIVKFPARQWKWHMLFDLLRIIAKGSVGATSDLRRSE